MRDGGGPDFGIQDKSGVLHPGKPGARPLMAEVSGHMPGAKLECRLHAPGRLEALSRVSASGADLLW
jgi:hypothetical protein